MNAPALLSREEFRERTRCCLRTAVKLLKSPTGPLVTKIGGRTYIREDHFQSWLDSCAQPRAASPPHEDCAA
jgi:hypothetical protein